MPQGAVLSTGLQVRMFGRAAVLLRDEPLSIPSKALELLCYLVLPGSERTPARR